MPRIAAHRVIHVAWIRREARVEHRVGAGVEDGRSGDEEGRENERSAEGA